MWSRFNYGIVHGKKTKIGNLIVGWNESDLKLSLSFLLFPDLSGRGDAAFYQRSEILKAYQNKFPTNAFIIYPDRKSYIGIEVCDWLEDEKLYVYVSQDEEVKAFTEFFLKQFQKK